MPRKSNASDVGSLGCTQRHNEKIYEVKEQIPYQFSGRDTDREVFSGLGIFVFTKTLITNNYKNAMFCNC